MSISSLIILTICSLLTAVISAVSGMGGGVVLLSIMTIFLPFSVIIPVHGLVQLVSNSTRSYFLKESIEWKIFKPFLVGLVPGALVATFIIKSVENKENFLIAIAILILYTLFKPKRLPHFNIPYWGFLFVGLIVGVLGPLIGSTGPLIGMFFIRDDLNKKQIVATKASVQMIGHLIKLPIFIYLGFEYFDYNSLIIFLTIGTVIGTKLGVKILHTIPENIFRIIFRVALFGASCRILYKAFF